MAPALAANEPHELTGLSGWVVDVVEALGPFGVGLLVLLENLFPPVPSEIILPLAGYLAGAGRLDLVAVIIAATVGSVLGALALYWLGAAFGEQRIRVWLRRLPLLDEGDLDRSQSWFDRHGGRAVLIGRVIPVVRSLVSIPAGVQRMPVGKFTLYTTIGSGVWNTIFVVLGYALGSHWTTVGDYSDVLNAVVLGAIGIAVAVFVGKRAVAARRARTSDS
ncbi:DedA family protein [Cryptosporangium phraense]|uniref:DedA family protein n=1 Tax=Cryptosporangium phraense TaxID=2593070 RepID=A0A545APQ4_9ACTN|nr:DedA family protein [Cryptosporangium phraense]TQS43307.1 DedA family protein [Cryptosporangium phraense]